MPKPVVIEGLNYAYPTLLEGQPLTWVLRGVDLEIDRGEFVSIMGPNGVGKTTLCLAMLGIVPQSTGGAIKGDVFISGHNTKHLPIAALAQQVGLVFQDPETQLFNRSAEAEVAFGLENLGLPSAEIGERIGWALELMGIAHLRYRPPAQMSGGEKQRLAIASVLAMKPQVLVLDEPTSNLDPLGKSEVFSAVDRLRSVQEMTIIMAEHESEYVAEYSDRVIVLHAGMVERAAPPRDVFADVERMRKVGLSVPQVSEVAAALNSARGTQYAFTRLPEAAAALARQSGG